MAQDRNLQAKPRLRSAKNAAGKPRRPANGNPAGRPTPEELERRIALVLKVATRLFIEQGFAATSLVEIARQAGVATRTIYFRFGDKEALFREVIYARDAAGALARPQVESGDTLFSALLRGADYIYAVVSDERSIGLMRLMIAESSRFPEFMGITANSIFARFNRNLENLFSQLEQAGLIPPADHRRSAEIFSDIVQGSHPIMIYTDWNAQLPSPADIEERIAIFIKGRLGADLWKTARTRKARLAAK